MDVDIQPDTVELVFGGAATKVAIGNKTELAIRNRAIEWKNFKAYVSELKGDERDAALKEFFTRFFGIITSQQDLHEIIDNYIRMDLTLMVKNLRKMFFLHEPLAWMLRELFFKIAHFYESILKKMVEKNGSWSSLIEKWTIHNPDDTSSKPLWNLTRDKEYQQILTKANPRMKDWLESLGDWDYAGFCPKVPGERLRSLLAFPIWSLLDISNSSMVEMKQFSSDLASLLANSTECNLSSIVDICVRMTPLKTRNPIASIDIIIEYEKRLLPALSDLEKHYIAKAQLFSEIVKIFPCGCDQ